MNFLFFFCNRLPGGDRICGENIGRCEKKNLPSGWRGDASSPRPRLLTSPRPRVPVSPRGTRLILTHFQKRKNEKMIVS